MKRRIENTLIKILIIFLLLILFNNFVFSKTAEEKRWELFKSRLDLSSEVELSTLFWGLGLFLFAIFAIIFSLIFMKKIPRTVLYIIITTSIVVLVIISMLYGDELTELVNRLNELQIDENLNMNINM